MHTEPIRRHPRANAPIIVLALLSGLWFEQRHSVERTPPADASGPSGHRVAAATQIGIASWHGAGNQGKGTASNVSLNPEAVAELFAVERPFSSGRPRRIFPE
jgi:hypothetical protein